MTAPSLLSARIAPTALLVCLMGGCASTSPGGSGGAATTGTGTPSTTATTSSATPTGAPVTVRVYVAGESIERRNRYVAAPFTDKGVLNSRGGGELRNDREEYGWSVPLVDRLRLRDPSITIVFVGADKWLDADDNPYDGTYPSTQPAATSAISGTDIQSWLDQRQAELTQKTYCYDIAFAARGGNDFSNEDDADYSLAGRPSLFLALTRSRCRRRSPAVGAARARGGTLVDHQRRRASAAFRRRSAGAPRDLLWPEGVLARVDEGLDVAGLPAGHDEVRRIDGIALDSGAREVDAHGLARRESVEEAFRGGGGGGAFVAVERDLEVATVLERRAVALDVFLNGLVESGLRTAGRDGCEGGEGEARKKVFHGRPHSRMRAIASARRLPSSASLVRDFSVIAALPRPLAPPGGCPRVGPESTNHSNGIRPVLRWWTTCILHAGLNGQQPRPCLRANDGVATSIRGQGVSVAQLLIVLRELIEEESACQAPGALVQRGIEATARRRSRALHEWPFAR